MDKFAAEAGSSSSGSGDKQVHVKVEPGQEGGKTEAEVAIIAFKSSIETTYREFQSLELEMKHIRAKAEQGAHKYCAGIAEDADSLSKKLKTFYTIIEKCGWSR